MDTKAPDAFLCPARTERKEVVVIGNGPSAIVLSYLLSGHVPYWNGCPVSNDYLNMKLEEHVKDASLLDQDLEFLSDGLEGRSRNPVSLLMDHLIHPDADLGARLQSKLKWRHEPTSTVDHVCLGRGGIGGVWNQLTSKHLQTVSMANWMELPNYSMGTFQQQRRARLGLRPDPPARATYDEVRAYYIHYVRRQRLTGNFSNGCEVTSMERVCPDAPFYDDRTGEIRTSEPIWKISGHDELTRATFVIHAKYVVLATGLSQEITRPLGLIGEQTSQSFTYTNLYAIENLIVNEKRLTTNSKSLLVIGCGLAAIDVILLCQQHSIPVLHVFRRAIDDHELVFNQLSATVFPDYERIKELIRQSSTSPNDASYQCCPQTEVLAITEDGTVHLRHLRTLTTTEHEISFVARLTGADVQIPFLSLSSNRKRHTLNVNPYTYECMDFDHVYALGALAGDKLVRFVQGGALACAASLLKKSRQATAAV